MKSRGGVTPLPNFTQGMGNGLPPHETALGRINRLVYGQIQEYLKKGLTDQSLSYFYDKKVLNKTLQYFTH